VETVLSAIDKCKALFKYKNTQFISYMCSVYVYSAVGYLNNDLVTSAQFNISHPCNYKYAD